MIKIHLLKKIIDLVDNLHFLIPRARGKGFPLNQGDAPPPKKKQPNPTTKSSRWRVASLVVRSVCFLFWSPRLGVGLDSFLGGGQKCFFMVSRWKWPICRGVMVVSGRLMM